MPTPTTVRVPRATHRVLREISKRTGRPMQDVVADAVESYRRQQLLEASNLAFAELRRDPTAERALRDDLALLEGAIGDGLSDLEDEE